MHDAKTLGCLIQRHIKDNLATVNLTKLETLYGKHGYTLPQLFSTFTKLSPKQYIQSVRKERVLEYFAMDEVPDIHTMGTMLGYNTAKGIYQMFNKWFGASYQHLILLKRTGALNGYLTRRDEAIANGKPVISYGEFFSEQILKEIELANGFITVEGLSAKFGCETNTLYMHWNRFNTDYTIGEAIGVTKITYARKQWLANPCTTTEFVERIGVPRAHLDHLNRVHYGETFGQFVRARRAGVQLRRNGKYVQVTEEHLNEIREAIRTETDSRELVAKRLGYSPSVLSRVLTGVCNQTYTEFRHSVVMDRKRGLLKGTAQCYL